MSRVRIVDVTDAAAFGWLPPCADPSFDHRTCDYWEDADRGSKAHRPGWLAPPAGGSARGTSKGPGPANPFAPKPTAIANPFATARTGTDAFEAEPANPFAAEPRRPPPNPFAFDLDDGPLDDNPFAPARRAGPAPITEGPRKLGLLTRGLAVFGSYAKVVLVADEDEERPVAYAQFGPLSAYPRALRLRELYPRLPQAPLPAVITCVATSAGARREGHALRLVAAVCDDLAGRGFAAVEAYPEANARLDTTSAASVAFWQHAGFAVAIPDERFPVVRREL